MTDEPGAPLFRPQPVQSFQQQAIVRGVGGAGPGISGRKDARLSAQGIDLQPAVVGQHPLAKMASVAGGLQSGIGGKAVAVFDHLQVARKIGQRLQLQAGRPEQLRQFYALSFWFAVPRTSIRGSGLGIRD